MTNKQIATTKKRVLKDIAALRFELAFQNHLYDDEVDYKRKAKLEDALESIKELVDEELEDLP